jgi:hypothetical protein
MQRPDRDPELSCHVGAVQRLAGVDGDELVEFPDQRQIVAEARRLASDAGDAAAIARSTACRIDSSILSITSG